LFVDEQPNPYKPTYTFPEKFDGDIESIEAYIRKTASQNIDGNYTKIRRKKLYLN
jgi:hypothetical protein